MIACQQGNGTMMEKKCESPIGEGLNVIMHELNIKETTIVENHSVQVFNPDNVLTQITDHAKELASHTLSVTKESVGLLRDALHRMEAHINKNENILLNNLNEHVQMAKEIVSVTHVIKDTLERWEYDTKERTLEVR